LDRGGHQSFQTRLTVTADPVRLRSQDDLTWAVRGDSDDRIGPGPHENGLHELMAGLVSPGSTFVDVGAHVGHYSLRMAKHCSRVVAIEPNPAASRALRANISLNKLTNVTVLDVAAHHRTERLRLWDPFNVTAGSCTRTLSQGAISPRPGGYGISTLYAGPEGLGKYLDLVDAQPIDAITGLRDIDLIKIDVEGNEGNALAGARRTIARHQPTVLVEMHHNMYEEDIWPAVINELKALNYRWDVLRVPQPSAVSTNQECEFIYAEPAARKLKHLEI
jgi:FkbM family methyltransferase